MKQNVKKKFLQLYKKENLPGWRIAQKLGLDIDIFEVKNICEELDIPLITSKTVSGTLTISRELKGLLRDFGEYVADKEKWKPKEYTWNSVLLWLFNRVYERGEGENIFMRYNKDLKWLRELSEECGVGINELTTALISFIRTNTMMKELIEGIVKNLGEERRTSAAMGLKRMLEKKKSRKGRWKRQIEGWKRRAVRLKRRGG